MRRMLTAIGLVVFGLLPGVVAFAGEGGAERDARLRRALDEIRVVREAESIVLGHVTKVHPSPGFWCGTFVSRQDVTYAIDETLWGAAAEGAVTIGHLLVHGTLFVEKEEPCLDPSMFYSGARVVLMLHRREGKWQAIDESLGIRHVDPPREAPEHLQPLLRRLLDLPELQPYFHPELEGRVPVVVELGEAVPVPVALTKFGKKVVFVPPELVRERARLVVSELRVDGKAAVVKFGYPAEGVAGQVRLRRAEGEWTVVESSVVEK